jgi:hypothetical protein
VAIAPAPCPDSGGRPHGAGCLESSASVPSRRFASKVFATFPGLSPPWLSR